MERPYAGSGRGLYTEVYFPAAIVRALFKLLMALQLKNLSVQKSHLRWMMVIDLILSPSSHYHSSCPSLAATAVEPTPS